MDPNETLRRMLAIVKVALNDDADAMDDSDFQPGDAIELAELVEAMDGWLSKGGALPDAWARRETVRAVSNAEGVRAWLRDNGWTETMECGHKLARHTVYTKGARTFHVPVNEPTAEWFEKFGRWMTTQEWR